MAFLEEYLQNLTRNGVTEAITALLTDLPHIIHVLIMDIQATFVAFVVAGLTFGSPSHEGAQHGADQSTKATLGRIGHVVTSARLQFVHPPPSYNIFHRAAASTQPTEEAPTGRKRRAIVPPANGAPAAVAPAARTAAGSSRRDAAKQRGFVRYLCAHSSLRRLCPMPRGLQQHFCYAFAAIGLSCTDPDTCRLDHIAHFRDLTHQSDKDLLTRWQADNATNVSFVNPTYP
jgi:hypothetical protein